MSLTPEPLTCAAFIPAKGSIRSGADWPCSVETANVPHASIDPSIHRARIETPLRVVGDFLRRRRRAHAKFVSKMLIQVIFRKPLRPREAAALRRDVCAPIQPWP